MLVLGRKPGDTVVIDGGITVTVLAIDHAGSGFNVALAAMNTLTNNQAAALGRINAEATQVAASVCGL